MSETTTTTTATTEQQEQQEQQQEQRQEVPATNEEQEQQQQDQQQEQQDQQQDQQQEVPSTNEEQTSPSVAAQQQGDNEDTTDSNNNKNETDNNKDDAVEVPTTTSTTTTTTTAVVAAAAASDEPKSPDSNENVTTSPSSTNNNTSNGNTNNKTSNNNNQKSANNKRRESSTEMPHHMNTNNVGAKLAARHHKQMMESLDRNNRATASALRTIDDITVKKKDYSSIHRAIEDLNRQEEQLFVEIPAKIGHTRIPKVDKKGAFVFTSPSKNNSSRDSNDNNETPARNNNDNSNGGGALVAAGATSPTSSFKIEPSPTPQKAKKKIQTMEDAGVEKLVPLPLRNVVPKSEIVSPSRFQNIPQPTENKKDALREKKQQELEKMIGSKPGEKGPARTTGNGFKPEQKPVKKVPKDFAPSCYEKRPSHWEEPEKATRKVLPPGMRFRSSPSVLKGSNSKDECGAGVADGEEGEEYEVQEETRQAEE